MVLFYVITSFFFNLPKKTECTRTIFNGQCNLTFCAFASFSFILCIRTSKFVLLVSLQHAELSSVNLNTA